MASESFPLITVAYTLVLLIQAARATNIMIREVDYRHNADYAKVFVTLRNGTDPRQQNSTAVDIDALIYQTISAGLLVRMVLASKLNSDYVTLLEADVDMCNSTDSWFAGGGLPSGTEDLLVEMLAGEMNKYGNMSIECPFSTGNYIVRNFHLDTENLLIRLAPPGEYRVGIDVKHQIENTSVAVPVFDIEFYATVITD